MKYYCRIILLLFSLLSLQGCSRQPNLSNGKLVTIASHAFANTLFYSGTIAPLKTRVVPSPADGVVVEMPFQYGEPIKSGQLLFMLSSTKFLTDYKSALMAYIKTKSDFNNSQTQLSEATFLHKNLLISDDDFKMKQSNYFAARLALLQAKDTLENLLHQLDVKDTHLYQLTISDIDKITQAMHLQMNSENLRILAPAEGIVLSPSKNEEENKKLSKGDLIKQGDVLAIIGDMNGISVRIKVNELTVNELKVGQKVKITGIAFPDYTLDGEINRVDRQGEAAGGSLPTFAVEVIVPALTKEQQKEIHVGMSAKVEIDIAEESKIMVPIVAIDERNGASFVQIYDEKARQVNKVLVKTGKTTTDSVAILSGLKTGDKIVIPN
jgi:HlyD family secretion protein